MNKLNSLNNWTLNKKLAPDKRMAFVTAYLKYPAWKLISNIPLKDRKKLINNFLQVNFKKLLSKKQFETFELIGTKNKPAGIKARISLTALKKLAQLSFISSIDIETLEGAKQKTEKALNKFFCVKMTVAIQVEGVTSGIQDYEERYVLVKAKSFDDAYKKVAKEEKEYGEPYINTNARLVRWKIESYDVQQNIQSSKANSLFLRAHC